jgi:hypothetical protein
MPDILPNHGSPPLDHALRSCGIRDRLLLGLVLLALAHTGEVLAGEQTSIVNPAQDPDTNKLRRSSPPAMPTLETAQLFSVPLVTDNPGFSSSEFRPRKRGVFDDELVSPLGSASMLRDTTVWQRMSEYKSHDRVRLLTLWESSASTVSLQAGKHGDPSLQWTSRAMNRGGATQGLLDRLFSVSLAHAGNSLRNATRSASAAVPSKQAGAPVTADLK